MKPTPLLLLLFLSSFATTDLHAATLRGKVSDVTGAAINADIFVYDNNNAPHPRTPGIPGVLTTADRTGSFTVNVPKGMHDLCVFAPGFTASCRKVFLKTDSAVQVQDFKMNVDPLATKEFGDYFPSR